MPWSKRNLWEGFGSTENTSKSRHSPSASMTSATLAMFDARRTPTSSTSTGPVASWLSLPIAILTFRPPRDCWYSILCSLLPRRLSLSPPPETCRVGDHLTLYPETVPSSHLSQTTMDSESLSGWTSRIQPSSIVPSFSL